MPHVHRLADGSIGGVARNASSSFGEFVADDDPDLLAFLGLDLAGAVRRKREEINAERDRRIRQGYVHDFGGGLVVPVDVRDERDTRNLTLLLIRSGSLVAAGQGTEPIDFVGADNVRHSLTATQVHELTTATLDRGQAIYAASWTHKEAVETLAAAEDADAIEAYDETAGPWPAEPGA